MSELHISDIDIWEVNRSCPFFSHGINIHFQLTESSWPTITAVCGFWLTVTFHWQNSLSAKCAILGDLIDRVSFTRTVHPHLPILSPRYLSLVTFLRSPISSPRGAYYSRHNLSDSDADSESESDHRILPSKALLLRDIVVTGERLGTFWVGIVIASLR